MPAGLAVIFDLGTTASLWTSPDGRAWTRSEAKIPYVAAFAIAHGRSRGDREGQGPRVRLD